jgi:predicted Zn-dependent protease
LIPEPDVGQLARTGGAPTWKTPGSETRVDIPPAAKTNAEAEALFRKALELDPSLIEARVRLARLLQVRGHHQESATELDLVFARKPTGVVAFYAHLFAGRAAESTGRGAQAAAHFADASALYPDAQSALLALSRHALLQADVTATLAPMARLATRSLNENSDPWWQYGMGAGRDADLLLKTMWAHVPR